MDSVAIHGEVQLLTNPKMSDLSSEKPAESPCFLFGKKPGGRQGPQSKPRIRPFSQALHLHHQTNGRLLTACSGVRFPPREPDFWYPVQQHPSLDMVDAAVSLAPDLKVPPGNRLKPLKGDLEGFLVITQVLALNHTGNRLPYRRCQCNGYYI